MVSCKLFPVLTTTTELDSTTSTTEYPTSTTTDMTTTDVYSTTTDLVETTTDLLNDRVENDEPNGKAWLMQWTRNPATW